MSCYTFGFSLKKVYPLRCSSLQSVYNFCGPIGSSKVSWHLKSSLEFKVITYSELNYLLMGSCIENYLSDFYAEWTFPHEHWHFYADVLKCVLWWYLLLAGSYKHSIIHCYWALDGSTLWQWTSIYVYHVIHALIHALDEVAWLWSIRRHMYSINIYIYIIITVQ